MDYPLSLYPGANLQAGYEEDVENQKLPFPGWNPPENVRTTTGYS